MNTGTNIPMYVLLLAEATEAVVDSESDSTREDESISWVAHYARQQTLQSSTDINIALKSLLPLFQDEVKSVAMIRHSMNIVKTAVPILNPGQVPVLTCDQPLYTIAKQIQWSSPDIYGEDQLVVMFGDLNIEMASLKVLGNILKGSG